MKISSGYSDPSTRPPRRACSGFRLRAQTPAKRLNLKLETRKSKLPHLALIALLALAFLGADSDARFNKLGHQLMCMCGCNQILLECNHIGCTYSDRMRNELVAGLQRGDTDALALQ